MMTKFAAKVIPVKSWASDGEISTSISSALEQLLGGKKYVGHTVALLSPSSGSLYFLVTVAYEE